MDPVSRSSRTWRLQPPLSRNLLLSLAALLGVCPLLLPSWSLIQIGGPLHRLRSTRLLWLAGGRCCRKRACTRLPSRCRQVCKFLSQLLVSRASSNLSLSIYKCPSNLSAHEFFALLPPSSSALIASLCAGPRTSALDVLLSLF